MIVAETKVLTKKDEKCSDIVQTPNPVWVVITDELWLKHKRKSKDGSQGFWPPQLSMELLTELEKTSKGASFTGLSNQGLVSGCAN